jgi:ATP-dependent DNA helicase RecQ
MVLRTARRGRNVGKQFWGCSGYASKKCKETLDFVGSEVPVTPSPELPETTIEGVYNPRVVVARSFRQGLDTVYIEYLTVPKGSLEEISDAHTQCKPLLGSQWRMSYARPKPHTFSPETVRTLSVAEKLVCKGRVTLLPEQLERLLNRPATIGSDDQAVVPLPHLDSPEELEFWKEFLPSCLGPSFYNWCVPQIEISSITGEVNFAGSEQRVDFLIAHPRLDKPLVIEIDGEQHSKQSDQDSLRDTHLEAAGCQVVRIPVSEARAGSGPGVDSLRLQLSALEVDSEEAESQRSPIRRAGQVQVAILQAINSGLFESSGSIVSTDLVNSGELTTDEFTSIVKDLSSLLERIGRMYGSSDFKSGFRGACDDTADLHLSFSGELGPCPTIVVDDAYLPFTLKWPSRPTTHGCPEQFDREDIEYFLQRLFRKPKLREGQFDIISRALDAKDTVALLPTGAGKSIAFQLAGILLPGRTIVIAPILSLIRDQVYNLRSHGIDRALGITSDLAGRDARSLAYELLKHGEAFFYYIAPERFQMAEFREKLRGMTVAYPVNLVVVDEAHCVSEWGHDFRTAYLRIGQTSRECSSTSNWTPALVALTGTASRAVLRDLQRELNILEFDAIVTPSSFDRKELSYIVLQEQSEHKPFVLESFLRNALPAEFGIAAESFFKKEGNQTYCGLVFCPNVNGSYGVVDVANQLCGVGIEAAYYSGSMPKQFWGSLENWKTYKRDTERRYKRDEVPVLVATKAFGMGVDKPNIRFTVHYGIPASIEAFYQEAGRAGRDGEKAVCAAIVSDDRAEQNRQMLAPATSIKEVTQFVKDTPYDQNDDITRMLFFHVQSFKGVEKEISVVQEVFTHLDSKGKRAARTVTFGRDSKLSEKALHRLVVVGIVADYTVDYSARKFSVKLADANRRKVIDKYVEYIDAYQRGRANQERKKAEAQPEEWSKFILGVVEQYVQFVYDVIERGQRRATAEMVAACQIGSGDELRKRILDYLDQAEYSEVVEKILSDQNAGLSLIGEVLNEVVSPNDASKLRGPVARSLETYPDHPGLLLLRTATEAMARDGVEDTIRENYEAFLLNAFENYGLSNEQVGSATGTILQAISHRNSGASSLLEQVFLSHVSERDAIRHLISESGITTVRISPWLLLLDQITSTIDY